MPIAENLSFDGIFRALFVGPKHSGKTVSACAWRKPDSEKMVKVIDGDGRIRGILGAPWIDKSKIVYDYFPPRVAGNDKAFYERLNADCEALLATINSGRNPYETYVGDSLTAVCKNFIIDAVPLTHEGGKGKKIGALNMAGPEDYGFESTSVDAYLSYLRSLPINVIVTAHVVDKFDKPIIVDGRGRQVKDTYAESVKVGEKLSIRDKIGQNVSIYFDHIFRFDRRMVDGEERFFVEFIGDLACTSFPNLKPGFYDITGKNFYTYVMDLVNGRTSA